LVPGIGFPGRRSWDGDSFDVHTLRAPYIGPLDAGEAADVLETVARRMP
jgi:hypothetical protein